MFRLFINSKPNAIGFLPDIKRLARSFGRFEDVEVVVAPLDHVTAVHLALEEITREAIGGRSLGGEDFGQTAPRMKKPMPDTKKKP